MCKMKLFFTLFLPPLLFCVYLVMCYISKIFCSVESFYHFLLWIFGFCPYSVVFALNYFVLPLPFSVVFALYLTLWLLPLPYSVVSDLPCYVVLDPNGLPLLTAWLDLWAQSHQIPRPHIHIEHLQELHIVNHVVGAVLTPWHHAINKTQSSLYTY